VSRLVIVSKSPASPPIRREHALAALAAAHGVEVVFIERPSDIRSARHDPIGWLRTLASATSRPGQWGRTVSPSVVVPGHRGPISSGVAERLMGRVLRSIARPGDVVCAMTPWDWPAVERLSGARRIFDCADDWPSLIPGRAGHLRGLVERAGRNADEVVVASPKLEPAFAPRHVLVVRNGASQECLARPVVAAPGTGRAVYVGTLSERIGVDLIEAALARLPHLRIDLFGPCAYAGRGGSPSPELAELLARRAGRLAWHGVLGRDAVPAALDAADVGLLPFDPELARGDIMKVYDYAARGRPIVSTAGVVAQGLGRVPGLLEAGTPARFADAIGEALDTPGATLDEARRWAEANAWETRWPSWRDALFGAGDTR
jgi:glycosyltransferase involved in cell wall biosynthesis